MKTLHVCNINYEWELETESKRGLKESFMVHPQFLQLQFLPFLYAKEGDGVAVTHHPPNPPSHIKVHLFDEKIDGYDQIETWGWSKAIERWTLLPYQIPKHLKEMASKTFAFNHSPNLPGAKLLHHPEEVLEWLDTGPYPKVLKSCFGFAGRRKTILQRKEDYKEETILKEFRKGYPIIGEPWVRRQMDFSTQWFLDDGISYLGATIMENSEQGTYRKTFVGREIPFLEEQKEKVQIPLKALLEMGFRGNVGVDAMVYENQLHPVVEINTRKTMGWAALMLRKSVAFETGSKGLLPNYLMTDKKISFQKQLKLI